MARPRGQTYQLSSSRPYADDEGEGADETLLGGDAPQARAIHGDGSRRRMLPVWDIVSTVLLGVIAVLLIVVVAVTTPQVVEVRAALVRVDKLLTAVERVVPKIVAAVEDAVPVIHAIEEDALPAIHAMGPIIAAAFQAEPGRPPPTLAEVFKRLLLPPPPPTSPPPAARPAINDSLP